RADHLLGPDGLRDHGRAGGRDASDPRLPSGALRGRVPDQETSAGLDRENRSAADCYSSVPDLKGASSSLCKPVSATNIELYPTSWRKEQLMRNLTLTFVGLLALAAAAPHAFAQLPTPP